MNRPGVSNQPCPPTLALERALLGEIEGSSSEGWQAHIEQCTRCQNQLQAMRAAGQAYAQSPEATRLAALLTERQGSGSTVRGRLRARTPWYLALAAAALGMAGLWVFIPAPDGTESRWQSKGGAALTANLIRKGVAERWQGQTLARGDVLELTWTSDRPGFLAVWARDDRGTMERILPEQGATGQPVMAGTDWPVGPGLTVQNDTLDTTVWAVFTEEPLRLEPFEAALRRGGPPALGGRAGRVIELSFRIGGGRDR